MTEGGTYDLLAVASAIPGIQIINDSTTAWMEAQRTNNQLSLSLATKLMPSISELSMSRLASNSVNGYDDSNLTELLRDVKSELETANGVKKLLTDVNTSYKTSADPIIQTQFKRIKANRNKNQEEAKLGDEIIQALNSLQPFGGKTGAVTTGISFAVSTVAQIADYASQLRQNYQDALNSAGQVITKNTPLTPYNIGWPIISVVLPTTLAAKQIDDYFNMFGYRVNELKQPNLFNRTKWDYIKTSNMILNQNAPDDARRAIEQIFNNGIRLHHDEYHKITDSTVTNDIA